MSKLNKVLFRCFRLSPDPLLNGCRVLGCFYTFHLQPGYKWLYDYIYTTRSTFNQDTNYLTQIYKSCVANLGHPWGRLLCDHPEREGLYCIIFCNIVLTVSFHSPYHHDSETSFHHPSFLMSSNRRFDPKILSSYNHNLRWSSRTLGSVCWADGSSSSFNPSIWVDLAFEMLYLVSDLLCLGFDLMYFLIGLSLWYDLSHWVYLVFGMICVEFENCMNWMMYFVIL